MAHLLITGGAGFIGSHTALVLLEAGHSLTVLDNFSNSSPESLQRVKALAGLTDDARLQVIEGDIRNPADLDRAFGAAHSIDGVIHFAGLKAVGESVQQPLRYWDVNTNGSRCLIDAMQRHSCRTIV
ncbi:MAG: SDR family NAD(P)-dependent oxidoreductase, partial [Cyanobacteria bacterium M_surface_7_m2_040]|nr:SDR family NAD(P)-dependent oxidoreductase [Cyanobacteria bacterium M_surface_7_m2_040]